MSFPLIVNPSPLQQLATTLQAIRERRMAFEDRRRQQEFEAARLMQMKQEGMLAERRLGLDEQRLTDARKNEDLDRQRQTMIDQRTQRQIDLAGRRQMEQDFLGSLPEGYTVTDPLVLSQLASRSAQAGKEYTTGVDPSVVSANAAMRSAEAIDVPGSLALAAQRAQPGERPVPGVANGIVYAPRPRSVSVSVGGSGGGRDPLAERQARQSADAMRHAIELRSRLVASDPTAAQLPLSAAARSGVARTVLGEDAGEAVMNRTLTANQREYRRLTKIAVDHYLGALRIRATNEVMRELRASLAPSLGQNDEQSIRSTEELANWLAQRVTRTAYGEDADISDLPFADQSEFYSGPRAAAGGPAGAPAPSGPTIRPRFMRGRP